MKIVLACTCFLIALFSGLPTADGYLIDFQNDGQSRPLLAGTMMNDQYAEMGLTISAENYKRGHPDEAILFDSSKPTGGDWDLATPGYHPSNTVPLGNLLIIAENKRDRNRDGRVDRPDDEGRSPAGYINFSWNRAFTGFDLILVDIEERGGWVDLMRNGVPVAQVPIPAMGDNSVQTLEHQGMEFDNLRVNMPGSGGIAEIRMIPEPAPAILMIAGAIALRFKRKTPVFATARR